MEELSAEDPEVGLPNSSYRMPKADNAIMKSAIDAFSPDKETDELHLLYLLY